MTRQCPHCGRAWPRERFHDEVDARLTDDSTSSYGQRSDRAYRRMLVKVKREFRESGCRAFGEPCTDTDTADFFTPPAEQPSLFADAQAMPIAASPPLYHPGTQGQLACVVCGVALPAGQTVTCSDYCRAKAARRNADLLERVKCRRSAMRAHANWFQGAFAADEADGLADWPGAD